MFGEGLKALLARENEIEILDGGSDTDIEAAVHCIQQKEPDLVIFNCDDPEPDINPAMLCILRERLGISVIGISMKDNSISVHRGERKQIHQLEDLLEVIHAAK
jgi:DNA-binding NarL/FixJ family response regulator